MDIANIQAAYQQNNFLKVNSDINFLKIKSDISPYHVYLKDVNGRFLECNKAQAKSFGLIKGDDVVGLSDDDFLPAEQASIIKQNDKKIIAKGMPVMLIEECDFKNSSHEKMISFKMPISSPSNKNKLIGLFGVSIHMKNLSLLDNMPNIFQSPLFVPEEPKEHSILTSKNISKREKECLQYLANGMTAKRIARELNLSPRTVEFYIENLKKKFSCHNRTELIAKALHLFNLQSTLI